NFWPFLKNFGLAGGFLYIAADAKMQSLRDAFSLTPRSPRSFFPEAAPRQRSTAKEAATTRASPAAQGTVAVRAAPSPIRFSRAICGDLGAADRREWWLATGRGVYAGGTIAGSLTRRYHGLLIAPIGSPLGRRLIF